jgi:hypothetical protein
LDQAFTSGGGDGVCTAAEAGSAEVALLSNGVVSASAAEGLATSAASRSAACCSWAARCASSAAARASASAFALASAAAAASSASRSALAVASASRAAMRSSISFSFACCMTWCGSQQVEDCLVDIRVARDCSDPKQRQGDAHCTCGYVQGRWLNQVTHLSSSLPALLSLCLGRQLLGACLSPLQGKDRHKKRHEAELLTTTHDDTDNPGKSAIWRGYLQVTTFLSLVTQLV